MRVEEDWVLVLNQPDDEVDSPQLHTVMSPYAHLDSVYAQVLWNYAEMPDFVAGGVQLQSWNNDNLVRSRRIKASQLSTTAETITWTQALALYSIGLYFEIDNGHSTTWGSFGRDMNIQTSEAIADLESYDTAVTVANSCVTYGSNRVDALKIVEVRRIRASGQVEVDSTPRVVFQWNDQQEPETEDAELD